MKKGTIETQAQVNAFIKKHSIRRQARSIKGSSGLQIDKTSNEDAYWRLRLKNINGRKRVCVTLGHVSDLTLVQAKQLAEKNRFQVAMGIDPKTTKQELKNTPTIKDFFTNEYLTYVKTYKTSWDTDECLIRNHIVPNFGHLYMDQLTKQHIIQFIGKHKQTHKPGSVNRVIILLKYGYNLALRWELSCIKKNPVTGIPLLEENNKKERYLTAEEANRLIEALKESDNKMLQYIVPMLLLTGARRGEVFKARWEDFNIEQRIWRIPTSKSGKARHVPMSDGVIALLDSLPRHGDCEWVFPNPKTKKPYMSIYHSWNTARKSVGLSDVRCHDCRHAFASFLINNGRSLYEVQKILGHASITTTQRYSHLSQDSLIAAANEVTRAVPLLMSMPKQVIDVPLVQISS